MSGAVVLRAVSGIHEFGCGQAGEPDKAGAGRINLNGGADLAGEGAAQALARH